MFEDDRAFAEYLAKLGKNLMRISSFYILAIAVKVISGISAWRSGFK
jgi:hypothetical protein